MAGPGLHAKIFTMRAFASILAACTISFARSDYTNIPYKYINDRPLELDIYFPSSDHASDPRSDPYPLIIYIHGGGWKGGSKSPLPPFLPSTADKAVVVVAAAATDTTSSERDRISREPRRIHAEV